MTHRLLSLPILIALLTPHALTSQPCRAAGGEDSADRYLLNPNGQIVAAAGLYQQYLMIYNFDLQKKHRSRPAWRSRQSAKQLLGTLQDALRN